MKGLLLRLLPDWLCEMLREWKRGLEQRRRAKMTVEEVFTDIYVNNRWGGEPEEFCSGSGTVNTEVVSAYVTAVTKWLRSNGGDQLDVVDLGCGDFRVGSQLVRHCKSYTGVDVVKPLIDQHEKRHGSERVRFRHLNIVEDDLPTGDVCLIRQVLQHLSNVEIAAVLKKTSRFKWTIVTEHQPTDVEAAIPNIDKAHGADIRLVAGSGVFLDKPPFSVAAERIQLLLAMPWVEDSISRDPGVLRTFVVRGEL